ncbi:hypothetical protein NPX13_g7549 [Xylaria arbuscula]|uniref:Tyrosinase copper-binding domain-containing protein n=1 Tax=Xylaria arbuscula TaxID=114810 RepID=A0A9W8TJD2_9PEZI|nr:hypothetical protein NPX13_g7549 [Xylaria arbuscula]
MRGSADIVALVLLLGSNGIIASPVARQTACTVKTQRKAWEDLTAAEKEAYIDADLCLMSTAPIAGVPGAESVWDELQYTHAAQADYIHNVDLCGYTGPLPYWNEPVDASALSESVILDPETGFGGDGSGSARCITDGPFVNITLRINQDLEAGDEYCIYRALNDRSFSNAVQTNVDTCLAKSTFNDAWNCIEAKPHSSGHGGVNGLMVDVALSPGDPIFWLHHGYIDKLWWDWEALKVPARLTEVSLQTIGGNNTARGKSDPAWVNYFGDNGTTTTLNHALTSHGLVPNATIADVMDIGGDYVCAEFV